MSRYDRDRGRSRQSQQQQPQQQQFQDWSSGESMFVGQRGGFPTPVRQGIVRRSPSPPPAMFGTRVHAPIVQQPAAEPDEWTCTKCQITNYNGRSSCFKCSITRYDSKMLDARGYSLVGVLPCDTLLIRELPSTATEESIQHALMKYSGVPVRRVCISNTRHYAFAQVKSAKDAEYMLKSFHKFIPQIDNCPVITTYSKRSMNDIFPAPAVAEPSHPHVAIPPPPQGGQGQAGGRDMMRTGPPMDTGQPLQQFVKTPFGQLQKYASPDTRSFQLEQSSGYYFDRETGFYYDAKSDYYYNPMTNKWMFWCSKYSAYIDCEGGDTEMKGDLQEEERVYQFRVKQQMGRDRGGRDDDEFEEEDGDVQMLGQTAGRAVASAAVRAGPVVVRNEVVGTSAPAPALSSAHASVLECLRQNQDRLADLREQLISARDQRVVAKIQQQIDGLLDQQRAFEATLVALEGGGGGRGAVQAMAPTPQLKRHITKETIRPHPGPSYRHAPERPPSVVELLEDGADEEEEGEASWRRKQRRKSAGGSGGGHGQMPMMVEGSGSAGSGGGSWRRRTAFDEHVEQAQMEGVVMRSRPEARVPNNTNSTGIEAQIRQLVDQRFQEELRNYGTPGSGTGKKLPRRSPSVEAISLTSRSRRSGSPRREEQHRQQRSSRRSSPPRHGNGTSRREAGRGGRERRSTSPMEISPQQRGGMGPEESWAGRMESWAGKQRGGGAGMALAQQQQTAPPMPPQPQFVPMPGTPSFHPFPPAPFGPGPSPMMPMPMMTPQQFQFLSTPGMASAQSSAGATFGLEQRQLMFASNEEHWQIAARQQVRFPGALSSSGPPQFFPPVRPAAPPGGIGGATSGGSSTFLSCQHCGCFGHLAQNCSLQLESQSKKEQMVEQEKQRLLGLNMCLNCGRMGHSQFNCSRPRISESELEAKIGHAKERERRHKVEKERLRLKAEKYPVRRKDPFVQALREVAADGMIKKELIRVVCDRCAGLNHAWNECKAEQVGRSLLKQMRAALVDFMHVFFVHLNEDNLVNFSSKFELFSMMDAIENGGTMDPIGLQLQNLCKDGVATQGDLRELCSKCANLGHKQHDCPDKEECGRDYYEKMLTLVKGYRALVKEGNGNFLLPNAKLKKQSLLESNGPSTSSAAAAPSPPAKAAAIEEIMLLSSDEEGENAVAPEKPANAVAQEKPVDAVAREKPAGDSEANKPPETVQQASSEEMPTEADQPDADEQNKADEGKNKPDDGQEKENANQPDKGEAQQNEANKEQGTNQKQTVGQEEKEAAKEADVGEKEEEEEIIFL